MYVTKIPLKITCLAIAAIGLSSTVSTLNLMKSSIPTTFAQPTTAATNNTQGMLTKFPFKPGIFVTPMSCTTPNDVLISRHQAGNSTAAEQLVKNQIMMAGGPNKNITANRLKQALDMEICFPTTLPQLKHFFSGNMTTP
jgi:hypothetical protein